MLRQEFDGGFPIEAGEILSQCRYNFHGEQSASLWRTALFELIGQIPVALRNVLRAFRVTAAPGLGLPSDQTVPAGLAGAAQQLARLQQSSPAFARWFDETADEMARLSYKNDSLVLAAKGTSLADCSPLTVTVGDRSYEASVTLEITGAAQGGLALFYDSRCHVGIGFSTSQMFTYNYGQEHSWMRQPMATSVVQLKVTNRANVVTFHYSHDGKTWTQHPWQMEVSGYHHNVFGGFLALKVAIFSAGRGEVRARNFVYRSLEA